MTGDVPVREWREKAGPDPHGCFPVRRLPQIRPDTNSGNPLEDIRQLARGSYDNTIAIAHTLRENKGLFTREDEQKLLDAVAESTASNFEIRNVIGKMLNPDLWAMVYGEKLDDDDSDPDYGPDNTPEDFEETEEAAEDWIIDEEGDPDED